MPKKISLIVGGLMMAAGVLMLTVNILNIVSKNQASSENKKSASEIYKKYLNSIHNNNKKEFKNLSYKGKLNDKAININSKEFNQAWNYLKQVKPKSEKVQVVNELTEEDKSILRVQLKTNDPQEREYGLIKLIKNKGNWKILKTNWHKPEPIENKIDDNPNDNIEFWNIFTFCNKMSLEDCLKANQKSPGTHPCITCIAERELKPELCNKSGNKMEKDMCLYNIAELTGDKKICNNLEDFDRLCSKIKENRDFIKSVNIYTLDSDKDGLSDALEIKYYTDLLKQDTDGDGYNDNEEVTTFHDPVSGLY